MYEPNLPLPKYRLLRLLIERIVTHDMALAEPEDIKEVLSRCFGCAAKLDAGEMLTSEGLCHQCVQRRLWELN